MRIAIVGATAAGVATAHLLIEHGYDVLIVENDGSRIDELSEDMDCAFVHGDGSRPGILREVGAADTHALLCLSDDDQDNIIGSLVGRSLGFEKVVTKISNPEFEHICAELSLEHSISADQTTARAVVDLVEGRNAAEASTVLRGDARFFVFTVRDEDAGKVEEFDLPNETSVLFAYRDDRPIRCRHDDWIEAGDDVVLLTRSSHLDDLRERWGSGNG